MGRLNKDITETLAGSLIFHWIIPAVLIVEGISGVFRHSIIVQQAPVEGVAAILYGIAFILVGLSICGMPSLTRLQARGFDLPLKIRSTLMLAAAVFFVIGVLSIP